MSVCGACPAVNLSHRLAAFYFARKQNAAKIANSAIDVSMQRAIRFPIGTTPFRRISSTLLSEAAPLRSSGFPFDVFITAYTAVYVNPKIKNI